MKNAPLIVKMLALPFLIVALVVALPFLIWAMLAEGVWDDLQKPVGRLRRAVPR